MASATNTYRPCRYCKLVYPACECKGYKKDRKASGSITIENWVEGVTVGEMMEYFKSILLRPDVQVAFSLRISKYEGVSPKDSSEKKEEV